MLVQQQEETDIDSYKTLNTAIQKRYGCRSERVSKCCSQSRDCIRSSNSHTTTLKEFFEDVHEVVGSNSTIDDAVIIMSINPQLPIEVRDVATLP